MWIYFLFIRLAALFGHRKARLLIAGQKQSQQELAEIAAAPADSEAAALRGAIWIHAASVGEFEQARPLIELYKRQNPSRKIVVTFFSPSGYEARKNYPLADKVMYLPFATAGNAKRFLDILQPKMVLFIKYEFWGAYLRQLNRRCVPTYLVSGIFRKEQLFFRWYGRPYFRLLTYFTHLFVQDENSRQLLEGGGLAAGRITVAGDTRFDRVAAVCRAAKDVHAAEVFASPNPIGEKPRVLVAGSTWPKDEELLIRYAREHEDVRLILVPHEVTDEHLHWLFNRTEGQVVRYTEGNRVNLAKSRILLVDTMGLLSSLYRYGKVAYVGGGFGEGIHNTLEPAIYGMPVVFGPNCKRFREAQGLIEAGAARCVKNYDEFAAAIDEAFLRQAEMGAAAKAYCEQEIGATQKVMKEITTGR